MEMQRMRLWRDNQENQIKENNKQIPFYGLLHNKIEHTQTNDWINENRQILITKQPHLHILQHLFNSCNSYFKHCFTWFVTIKWLA